MFVSVCMIYFHFYIGMCMGSYIVPLYFPLHVGYCNTKFSILQNLFLIQSFYHVLYISKTFIQAFFFSVTVSQINLKSLYPFDVDTYFN